jgi:glutamyl-tRNA synthetase
VPPRLRFAPSPTGYLHVGGARTALFNWLYVRRHGGTFVLRIEDTDTERSSADMVTGILDSLTWLGLDWDEGPGVGGPHAPYFQTQRIERHRAAAEMLVASSQAYLCFCSPEDIKAKRDAAEGEGGGWIYDRTCRQLRPDEVAAREAADLPRATRFLVPPGETAFEDLVHGRISVSHANIEDFVILRSDGNPTYHLSVVADDVAMKITHVVRGDDHISNTPKQILLYEAMRAAVPAFAHVPLILGPDRKRLSKRHGATSVGEYEKQGYLPEAMVNFLALLGWSPGKGNEEVFTRDELASRFTLEGIGGGNAVFNSEKLDWFNQQHLLRLSAADLLSRLEADPTLPLFARIPAPADVLSSPDRPWIARVVDLVKPRVRKLGDLPLQLRPFIGDSIERDAAAVAKYLAGDAGDGLHGHLGAWLERLRSVDPFDAATIEPALRQVADARGIKPGVLIHATRVAVTGQAVSPGLFEVLELVGRARTIARLSDVLRPN